MTLAISKLDATFRAESGKGFARRTRLQGLIPAVVYGPHLEKPFSIAVDPTKVREAIKTSKRLNTVIGITVDGKEHTVLLKDYQLDPVSNQLLHADFLAVKENEEVKVQVPIAFVGRPVGVIEGGILSQMRRDLTVWAKPGSIPESIQVDISALKIAQALHVNEVTFPAGVRVRSTVNFTIAVVTAPEIEKVAEVTPEAAATAAGAAAAPGAAGATPAAGTAAGAPAAAGDKKAPAAAAKAPAKK